MATKAIVLDYKLGLKN